jgi:HEAT repeat protein
MQHRCLVGDFDFMKETPYIFVLRREVLMPAVRSLLILLALSCGWVAAEASPEVVEETDPDVLRKVRKLILSTRAAEAEEKEKGWKGLKDMGNLAVPGLLGLYKQKATTTDMMESILIALGDSADPRAGPALVEILKSTEPRVRRDAARAIGDSNYKAGAPALEKIAGDSKEEEEVRLFAAASGAKFGNQACIAALKTLLKSEKPEIRSRAIFALGKAGGPSEVTAIEAGFEDKDSSVREDAVEALRRIGTKDVYPLLVKAIDDEDYKVRGAAMDALRQLTKKKIENDPAAWKEWWAKQKDGGSDDDKKDDSKKKDLEDEAKKKLKLEKNKDGKTAPGAD